LANLLTIRHDPTPTVSDNRGAITGFLSQFAASFYAFVTADKMLPSIFIGIDSGDPSGSSDNNRTADVLADGGAYGQRSWRSPPIIVAA
jgi:hypothetical protein